MPQSEAILALSCLPFGYTSRGNLVTAFMHWLESSETIVIAT